MDTTGPKYTIPLLTQFLLDNIIFAMEDQSNYYYLDLKTGEVISEEEMHLLEEDAEEDFSDDRVLSLPDWEPSDGFLIMEKFANQVRNPLYNEKLIQGLQAGKGVFRRFKDTIAEQPALERQWFAFKDEQLKRVVLTWYKENDGAIQLLDLDPEPEELTDDILQEDFIIASTVDAAVLSEIQLLQKDLLKEMEEGSQAQQKSAILLTPLLKEKTNAQYFHARTHEGVLAGFLSYEVLDEHTAHVLFFGNKKEFRGMGLFRHLFDTFCRHASRKYYTTIILDLSGDAVTLDRLFTPLQSTTITKRIALDTNAWNENRISSETAFL